MIRIERPVCGVCGGGATYRSESLNVLLCYQCVRPAVEWLWRNQCLDNVLGFELVHGVFEEHDGRGYRIWIRSESSGSAMAEKYIRFDSKLCP